MKGRLVPIALIAGTLLAGVFLAVHLHLETREKVLSQFNGNQLLIARQAAGQIESYFLARSRDLRNLSSLASLRHLDRNAIAADIRANIDRWNKEHIKEIIVLDAKGASPIPRVGTSSARITPVPAFMPGRRSREAWEGPPADRQAGRAGVAAAAEGAKPPAPRIFLVTPLSRESSVGGSTGPGGIQPESSSRAWISKKSWPNGPSCKHRRINRSRSGYGSWTRTERSCCSPSIRPCRRTTSGSSAGMRRLPRLLRICGEDIAGQGGRGGVPGERRKEEGRGYAPMTFDGTSWIVVLNVR